MSGNLLLNTDNSFSRNLSDRVKHAQNDVCVRFFTAALFDIAKTRNNPHVHQQMIGQINFDVSIQ